MDALFLQVLYSRPDLAPELFFSLFSKVDSVRVARFMSDRAGLADCLRIMSSLPPVPFLSELAKTIGLPYDLKKRRGGR